MSERLHPQSINDLRQLVRLHGAERVAAALDEVVFQESPKKTATERRFEQLEARGLKGDGKEVILASAVQLGDIVRLKFEDNHCNPYADCTVKEIHDDGQVTLFRPYTATSDFSTSSGVICYVGIEEFTVSPFVQLVLRDASRGVR